MGRRSVVRYPRVVVRICGGLGNQLFAYAAARRLAWANGAKLMIDAHSGFEGDKYDREYRLDFFMAPARCTKAGFAWRGVTGKFIRAGLRLVQSADINAPVTLLEEPTPNKFYPWLIECQVRSVVYLQGYWQSPLYFADIAEELRDELKLQNPPLDSNQKLAQRIGEKESVCIHVRRVDYANRLSRDYYEKAIQRVEAKVANPVYVIFGDDNEWARNELPLDERDCIWVGKRNANREYEDLWLMSQCHHHIIANSTFSWWGAWLAGFSKNRRKIGPENGFPNPRTLSSQWDVI